jgi:hypothetical protein
MDKAILARVHLFPVRHHSPRSSAVLRAFLDQVRPKLVLVEGPSDATPLIDVIVDKETRPPIAVLGYRTDGIPGSSLWPFASYSPEYVALAWASRNGAVARFIDVPIGQALAQFDPPDESYEGEPSEAEREGLETALDEVVPDTDPAPHGGLASHGGLSSSEADDEGEEVSVELACALARGYRSFEEFWEASFEAPAYNPDEFRTTLIAYADLVRKSGDRAMHRARDAYMAKKIIEAAAEGFEPEAIAVVVGAAHAAAFAAGDVDLSLTNLLPHPVPTASTLIPFSYPRLAEQLGYGAGNRAPQYYQRAHDAGGSFRRATLEVLVEFTEHLRVRGFMVSLADTIEAYRLAVMLAEIRGKAEPGLDEVREATVATMCRGDATHIDSFLWPSVIGKHVGKVASRIGQNSLQEEFWREVRERELPVKDSPEQFKLRLNNEVEVSSSVFLHRLRIAGVPYASFAGTQMTQSRRAPAQPAGGYAALGRVTEVWEARWTPATDMALVEKIVLGDSFEQVTTRLLEERLEEALSTGDAADVLLEAVVTQTPHTVSSALRACDNFASTDDDLPSLARACRALSGLVSFGSSRAAARLGDEAIIPLLKKTFARAVLRVPGACLGSDEAVQQAKDALRTLHDVALSQPLVDKSAFFAAARALVASYAVNPGASGLACGLLYLAQAIRDDEVMHTVTQRLSNVSEPEAAAAFLGGFFEVNALVLVKSRPVAQALDAFLMGIEPSRFRDALPILRRAFSALGPTERRYLLENVVVGRSLGDRARAAQAVLLERDKQKLRQMSEELSEALHDLDDLL